MGKCTCHFLSRYSSPSFLSSSSGCTPKSQSWVHSEVPTLKPLSPPQPTWSWRCGEACCWYLGGWQDTRDMM